MRRFKRYICLVGLLALLAAALTGCGFSDDSVEELFTLAANGGGVHRPDTGAGGTDHTGL